MQTGEKTAFFRELLSITKNVYLWHYTYDMLPISSNCPMQNIFVNIFALNQCGIQVLAHFDAQASPLIISDHLGIVWACCADRTGPDRSVYIIGPVFTADFTLKNLEKKVNEHEIPLTYKKTLLQFLADLPVVPATTLFEYALMLHYTVTGEKLQISDLTHASQTAPSDTSSSGISVPANHAGIWTAEQTLLKMVEDGNSNWKDALNKISTLSIGTKIQSENPLRQAQDSVIIFVSLCTRAAIRGGLSPETAYNMSDYYIQNVEQCRTIADVTNTSHQMFSDFIGRVQKTKQYFRCSEPVRICLEYIDLHILEKIALKQLAAYTGYTEYYLTKKFRRETGVSLNEHIRSRKIEYAKILLSTTDKSVAEISAALGFSSRSFFTDSFLRATGMTPTEFRKKASAFIE